MAHAFTTIAGPTASPAVTQAVENQTKGIGEHNGEAYVTWAAEAAQHLHAMAPDHPAALEAAVQVDLLQGGPLSSPDPM